MASTETTHTDTPMTHRGDASVPTRRGRQHHGRDGQPGYRASYRLVVPPATTTPAPVLDPAQRRVVEHRGGPLLVLAGPGTGKTTTLVEAVVDRVERGGPGGAPLRPEQVLVLTFSRRAAGELRARITARLGQTTTEATAWTFHGFCYAVLRRYQDADGYADPLRLLSAPEQHAKIAELLAHPVEGGQVHWPDDLRKLVRHRGFVEEVRALLARVRQLGLDPVDLAQLGEAEGRADWSAAAAFCNEYLEVLALQGILDYSELVRGAVDVAADPAVREELRRRYAVVFVDEYQDTDPAQEALLRLLAGDARDLVVVGDPDQSIYAFRGADVRGILDFPDRFLTSSGAPAPTVALEISRRGGASLLAASRAVARRMPLAGLSAATVRAHRALTSGVADPGTVEVSTYPSEGSEVAAVADVLRRAHLEDGLAWSEMAVLVRSGTRSIPALRRTLGAAGVPVDVAGDELPLVREPAVQPLLRAVSCIAARDVRSGEENATIPWSIDADSAHDLLVSPFVRATPGALRRLGRALRVDERARAVESGTFEMRGSAELVAAAVADARLLSRFDPQVRRPAVALRDLLDIGAAAYDGGGTVEDVLWALWSATSWPRRLAEASFSGGAPGRRADADLDAVVALFRIAARSEERAAHRGVANFVEDLAAQQIPADTLAERGIRDGAVRLLTAHRSKGLEWELVVVPGVQEDVWPDLRRRGSLLDSERIGRAPGGFGAAPIEPPTAAGLLVEERRLFYVAATRARKRVVVTAVADPGETAERPSRFLYELGVDIDTVDADGSRQRPLDTVSLVADLRATATDPEASLAVRECAVGRLATLAAAAADDDGRPLVPAAHPDAWWGVRAISEPGAPIYPPERAIPLSGSSLKKLQTCPLQWFFDHEARGAVGRTTALGFGSIVHAIAEAVTVGELPDDIDTMMARVEKVWPHLEFDEPWHAERELAECREALHRFLTWHRSERGRTTVAAERSFDVEFPVCGRSVRLRGRADRVELDAAGAVWIIDFKTTKNPPTEASVRDDVQLQGYQLAVRNGALDEVIEAAVRASDDVRCGGAELVQLRRSVRGTTKVQSQPAFESAPGDSVVEAVLESAVVIIDGERFPARPSEACRTCAFRAACPAMPEGQQVIV